MTAGQTKNLRNLLIKNKKTDDGIVLSKDNSNILNKLEKEFNVSEQDGADIHGNLATIVQKLLLLSKIATSDLKLQRVQKSLIKGSSTVV